MRAEEEKKGNGKRIEKKRKKEDKMGIKKFFLYAHVFLICAVVIFRIYKKKL